MEFLINNWVLIVSTVAVVAVGASLVIKFFNMPTPVQVAKVKEWLVYACMEAEKELGRETGQLKLRMVYDMFLTKFNWLAKVITFEKFSNYVDEALAKFKDMLNKNEKIQKIVNNEG